MKRIIITIITVLALTLLPAGILNGSASAACPSPTTSKGQVLDGAGKTGNCDDSGVPKLVSTVVEVLSIIVGAVAIIMIIYSGFKYITSGGDSAKVSSAKNTLIYALVGVIIVVLAQLLVRFVITQADTAANACQAGYHRSADGRTCIRN